MDFLIPTAHRVKVKENEKIDKFTRDLKKKAMEHEGGGDPIYQPLRSGRI